MNIGWKEVEVEARACVGAFEAVPAETPRTETSYITKELQFPSIVRVHICCPPIS